MFLNRPLLTLNRPLLTLNRPLFLAQDTTRAAANGANTTLQDNVTNTKDDVTNTTLQDTTRAAANGAASHHKSYHSPPLPQGEILISTSSRNVSTNSSAGGGGGEEHRDGVGREYTQIVMGPGRLTKPSPEAGDVPRVLLGVPTFNGNGVTMSFW